jgi:hypothetical protein
MKLPLLVLAAVPLCVATEVPFAGETLRYSINWPTGLSLGEAEMTAKASTKDSAVVEYEFRLDASLPGFPITDVYRSLASSDFCLVEFEKRSTHGSKKVAETTIARPSDGVAIRETENGGKSVTSVPACVKDGLTFLYWLRAEIQRGRLPPPQTILFGAPYRLTLKFAATERILVNEQPYEADRIEAFVKGPASETRFEMYVGRDPARRLLKVRIPFVLGSFSMELLD